MSVVTNVNCYIMAMIWYCLSHNRIYYCTGVFLIQYRICVFCALVCHKIRNNIKSFVPMLDGRSSPELVLFFLRHNFDNFRSSFIVPSNKIVLLNDREHAVLAFQPLLPVCATMERCENIDSLTDLLNCLLLQRTVYQPSDTKETYI